MPEHPNKIENVNARNTNLAAHSLYKDASSVMKCLKFVILKKTRVLIPLLDIFCNL